MFDDSNKAGQWEVVGGKSDKVKSSKSSKSPTGGKNAVNGKKSALKVDELVTPMDTKYALLDPEMRAQAKRDALGLPPPAAAKTSKGSNKENKADGATKKSKPSKDSNKENKEHKAKTLPEALKLLNLEELTHAMTVVKARFANSRLLWLKELTSYLNNNLSVETDPTFAGKPRDYPSNLLSPELKGIITTTIKECGAEEARIFYTQSLITMPTDINRGVHVNGTKIVLQLLSFHTPTLARSFLPQAKEILGPIESRVPATLSLLWVLSQPAVKDSCVGLQVWHEVMLPLIHLKNYTAFVGQAAGQLVEKGIKNVPESLTVNEFFRIKDQLSGYPSVARQNVSDLIDAISPAMISQCGGKMFGQLLKRLDSNQPAECQKLVQCLNADVAAFESWRKEYRNNLMSSSQLLQWITENESPKRRQDFQALLLNFRKTNETIPQGKKTPSEALKNCTRLCEALLADQSRPSKKSGSGGRIKFWNYLLLISLIALVWYDVRVHGQGSFEKSRLGGALHRHGITDKAVELYERTCTAAQPYLDQAKPYLEKARPYLDQMQKQVLSARDVIYKKGEELYPGIWAQMDLKYQAGVKVVKEQSGILYDKATVYAQIGLEKGAFYAEKFLDWSAVYRQQAVVYGEKALENGKIYSSKAMEVANVYYNNAAKFAGEVVKDDRVQNAWKYTQDMYHKALHAVGICTH